jgi:hypothetical protein
MPQKPDGLTLALCRHAGRHRAESEHASDERAAYRGRAYCCRRRYSAMVYAARMERWGGYSALLMAALFSAALLLTTFLPPAEVSAVPFWLHVLIDYLLAIMGLLGLALIPAVQQRLQMLDVPIVHWTGGIAQLGFALTAILGFWQADYETNLWRDATPEASSTLAFLTGGWPGWLQVLMERMPRGWLETAGIGLWIFVVSLLGHRLPVWPASLAQMGLVLGPAMVAIALGAATRLAFLHVFGLLNYLILWPLWLFRMGWFLLHPVPLPIPVPRLEQVRRTASAWGRRLRIRRAAPVRPPTSASEPSQ